MFTIIGRTNREYVMGKLQINFNKSLKLNNVLCYKLLLAEQNSNIDKVVSQMQAYMKTKGGMQVGPLIQKTDYIFDSEREKMDIEITIMLQCDKYINKVDSTYRMEPVITVKNAIYCRYNGPENCLRFAYDKINVEAFENAISIEKSSYTIFLNVDDLEGSILADVFVPKSI